MSGSGGRKNEKDSKEDKEGEGSGWASTFFKVAGAVGAVAAAAVVAGSVYSILKQPKADVTPYRVQQTRHHNHHHEEEEEEADVAPYRVQQTQYEEELVILYVDGSHKPDIPLAACGGFLCNTSGKWICGFTQKLDPNLRLDQVEKQAILTGLLWVHGMGKRNVLVKSDREEAVKSVNNPVISKSTKDDPLICDIKKVLDSPHWKCKPELIPILRDENKVADKLAKKAHNFTSFNLQHFVNRSDIL
ncbi:uncharacterized protein LOC123922733 isoform X1 [Trifolium pratense]|uniref:uncharacterized protein LOC123922733 isoform X1 n=1 Tax=Trifolium pratense TaxID=57577 RepID=UPI001E692E72|nr:uncharacterized protein LOC123922733 isoform X1 [Trifolium pratense]